MSWKMTSFSILTQSSQASLRHLLLWPALTCYEILSARGHCVYCPKCLSLSISLFIQYLYYSWLHPAMFQVLAASTSLRF
jgi:hypothetical protein